MTDPIPSPYDTARRHVAMVAEHLHLSADKTGELMSRFEQAVRCDPNAGTLSYVDAAGSPMLDANDGWQPVSTAAWLRSIAKAQPDLLPPTQSSDNPAAPSPATADTASMTVTQLMVSARAGNAAAAAEIERRGRGGSPSSPQPASGAGKPNIGQMMLAVRNNVPGAKAALEAALGGM